MSVTPIPHEATRYFVQSSSRPEMDHTVDTDYQESSEKPHYACGCERYMAHPKYKGQPCEHIHAVRAFVASHRPDRHD